ncbi:hypothetical protein KI387_018688, partial [Taxus chinensis]
GVSMKGMQMVGVEKEFFAEDSKGVVVMEEGVNSPMVLVTSVDLLNTTNAN